MTSNVFVIVKICRNQFKCNYLKDKKLFLNFSLYFQKLHQISNILKKEMTLAAYVFLKVHIGKDLVRPLSKERCFRIPLNSHYVKGSQTLVKSAWQYLYHILSSFWGKLTWKMSLLVICKILGNFVNTLIADDKDSLRNREFLPQPIQMLLSKKQNTFSQFFAGFLKFIFNFKYFEKGWPS